MRCDLTEHDRTGHVYSKRDIRRAKGVIRLVLALAPLLLVLEALLLVLRARKQLALLAVQTARMA